uniref:RING-type domain-containing protein n=1 Tax=Physcomitrium patens TaxID=3218 RepID=A0A7I4DBE0_PHYPA
MGFEDEEPFGASSGEQKYESAIRARAELDRDFLCPICLQTMEDAFLTRCGHSFCYSCIMTHLNNRSNCPCCAEYLTIDLLMPNFLLTKLMKKASAFKMLKNASPADPLLLALQQGADLPANELDSLLLLLNERKQKLEREEAESNIEILLDFLHHSQSQKQEKLQEVQNDLQFLKDDITTVERRLRWLLLSKDRHSKRVREESPFSDLDTHTRSDDASTGGAVSVWRGGQGGAYTPYSEEELYRVEKPRMRNVPCTSVTKDVVKAGGLLENDPSVDFQVESGGVHKVAKKRKVLAQFEELQDAYLLRRRQVALKQRQKLQLQESVKEKEVCRDTDKHDDGLGDFESMLMAYTRYSQLRVVAELHHGDLFQTSSNIVSSIDFDGDDELFATAGVSRRIKVFDFATVMNDLTDVHCPVAEFPTRSKLSCLSWNKFNKPLIASSDYEGIVTVWDINRSQVKLWCTNQEASVFSIDMKANICCVKYNPGSSNHIAIGSADHHIYYYDLRNPSNPLVVFKGHRKAVSYVKFISSNELASASTDSTLRLWDVQTDSCARTFRGHTNEKNFVGLTVNNDYIACGSETNEVVVYHKAMSKPCSSHKFGSPNSEDIEDDGSHFISAVCWKSESPTMLAANSQGIIKVLVLAA